MRSALYRNDSLSSMDSNSVNSFTDMNDDLEDSGYGRGQGRQCQDDGQANGSLPQHKHQPRVPQQLLLPEDLGLDIDTMCAPTTPIPHLMSPDTAKTAASSPMSATNSSLWSDNNGNNKGNGVGLALWRNRPNSLTYQQGTTKGSAGVLNRKLPSLSTSLSWDSLSPRKKSGTKMNVHSNQRTDDEQRYSHHCDDGDENRTPPHEPIQKRRSIGERHVHRPTQTSAKERLDTSSSPDRPFRWRHYRSQHQDEHNHEQHGLRNRFSVLKQSRKNDTEAHAMNMWTPKRRSSMAIRNSNNDSDRGSVSVRSGLSKPRIVILSQSEWTRHRRDSYESLPTSNEIFGEDLARFMPESLSRQTSPLTPANDNWNHRTNNDDTQVEIPGGADGSSVPVSSSSPETPTLPLAPTTPILLPHRQITI